MEIQRADYRGYVTIGGKELACAVLANGRRVISQTSLFDAFDRPRKGEKRQENLPSILNAKNLLPLVSDELREKCKAIPYYHSNGQVSLGYDAELIPLVAELYLQANDAGDILLSSQERLVERSRIIVRSLAKLGITALIDEATGYQYARESDELQKILKAYIAEDFLKWQARFPRKFYQEAFRLCKWNYDPTSLKRPAFLGNFTNTYVYKQLPPGILDELRKKNPKIDGHRRRKHHQHLTPETGIPHLDKHLIKLVTIMELSKDLNDFKNNFKRIFGTQLELNLEEPTDSSES